MPRAFYFHNFFKSFFNTRPSSILNENVIYFSESSDYVKSKKKIHRPTSSFVFYGLDNHVESAFFLVVLLQT